MKEEKRKQEQRPIPPPPSVPPVVKEVEPMPEKTTPKPTERIEPSNASPQCTWRDSTPVNTTINVRDFYEEIINILSFLIFKYRQLYETLPFDDQNGGVWKQGFEIRYDQSQWTADKKLKVILMPHSHCDPGRFDY